MAKTTDKERNDLIRELRKNKHFTYIRLGKMFGLSKQRIEQIIKHKSR